MVGGVRMLGERVQRADEQPVLPGHALLLRADDLVGGFDDHVGCRVCVVVGADRFGVGGDGFGLGDDVEGASLRDEQVGAHERFESRPEPRFGTAYSFGDGAYLAMPAGEQGDDAVGLAEFRGAQHHAFVTVERHGFQSLRRQ